MGQMNGKTNSSDNRENVGIGELQHNKVNIEVADLYYTCYFSTSLKKNLKMGTK